MEKIKITLTNSVLHIIRSTGYSLKGFKSAIIHETAFRQELLLALILIPLAFLLGDNKYEVTFMIASVLMVLLTELINSAIEATIDRIGLERHELSQRAKDLGSAAVFISISMVVIIWGLVLFY